MANEPTDWELVEQIAEGDDRAFDALMEKYSRPVLNFVWRMIGDAGEAEDVAQDVFVRVYRSIKAGRCRPADAKFTTWLFHVARNAALDCLRRRRRHPAELRAVTEDGTDPLAVTRQTAARDATSREEFDEIAAAVGLLPEDQRAALLLAEYEDFSHAEIAAALHCSEKAVESRLYRARQFLRRRLARLLG